MYLSKKSFVTELMRMNEESISMKADVYSFDKDDDNSTVVLSKKLAGIENIYIQSVDHPQGIEGIRHSNDFFEILYSPSGDITLEIYGREEVLNKNETLFLNKNVVYKVSKVLSDTDLLCHVFVNEELFDDDFFHLLQENNVFSLFIVKSMLLSSMYKDYIKTKNIDKTVFILLDLLRRQTKYKNSSREILISYCAILFDKLKDFENNLLETDEFICYYRKNAQILRIIGYIRKNYQNADLKSVAENVHLHSNYLCNLVKSVTGKTFTELLNSIKVQAAKYMLESTDLSIEYVSAAVGYDNTSYFYKTFKKIIGKTPGECRIDGCQKQNNPIAYTKSIYSASYNDIAYLTSHKLIYNRDDNPKIAFMPMGTELNYYMVSIENGLFDVIHDRSVELYTAAPKNAADSKKQIKILKEVIEQKPHAIIICSHDLYLAAPLFRKAIETGIAICLINHDNINLPVPVHAVVGYRQKEATRRMGAYITEKFCSGNVKAGIIRGVPGYHSTERFMGFIEPLAGRENFSITSIQNGLWTEQSGFDTAHQMLLEHPEINLIFAENDHQAVGAIKAARQLRRLDVKIFGHDGAVSGLRNIVSGRLTATTDTHPVEMGNMAIMSVLNCLDGNITGSFIETPTDIVDKRNVVTALVNN